MQRLLAALMLIAGLAGCLGDDAPEDLDSDNDGFSDSVELDAGTDPNDPSSKPVSNTNPYADFDDALAAHAAGAESANIELLSQWGSGAAEIDAWENFLVVDSADTIYIVDVSDPNNPVEVGSNNEVPRVLDVKWSDDGNYIIVGDDERVSGDVTGDLPTRTGGVYILDASDKSNPTLVEHLNVGQFRGPHMVFYYQTNAGEELVLGANGDVGIFGFDRAANELTELSRYSPGPLAFNRDPSVIDAYYQMTAHDMFAMYDPITEQDLMYVANWDAGLRIVDISNPSNPVELGGWNDYGDGETGNLHTVVTEWIGDRRITAGAVEVGFNVVGGIPYVLDAEPSLMYIWDTTDPANIQLLGTWTNPDGLTTGLQSGSAASTHNIQLEQGRITMAHYALGVWIMDISTPERQAEPFTLGYYDVSGMNTWDVVPHDGVIWSAGSMGVQGLLVRGDIVGEGPRGRA